MLSRLRGGRDVNNFVSKQIEDYLTQVFKLPIVKDVLQTKIEQVVSYKITSVKVRNYEGRQRLSLGITVYWRNPNGYDAIGLLSQQFFMCPASGDRFTVDTIEAREHIEYLNKTNIVLSKSMLIHLDANEDITRERIKYIVLAPPKSIWILENGIWNDQGKWVDTALWKDFPTTQGLVI